MSSHFPNFQPLQKVRNKVKLMIIARCRRIRSPFIFVSLIFAVSFGGEVTQRQAWSLSRPQRWFNPDITSR